MSNRIPNRIPAACRGTVFGMAKKKSSGSNTGTGVRCDKSYDHGGAKGQKSVPFVTTM